MGSQVQLNVETHMAFFFFFFEQISSLWCGIVYCVSTSQRKLCGEQDFAKNHQVMTWVSQARYLPNGICSGDEARRYESLLNRSN